MTIPLVLALILAGGLVLSRMPGRYQRWAPLVTVVVALGVPFIVAIGAAHSGVGFHAEVDDGELVPHVDLLLRLTPAAFGIVVLVSIALLATAADAATSCGERVAHMVAAFGACVAAFGDNEVLLSVGVAIVTASTLLASRNSMGRIGRGSTLAYTIGTAAAVALVASAAQLLNSYGTSNFDALPPGAVTVWVAMPWALVALCAMASPLLTPSVISGRPGLGWASVGAVPVGAAILLHLGEATVNAVDGVTTAVVSVIACLAGALAVAAALMTAKRPPVAIRFLATAVAMPAVALALQVGQTPVVWGLAVLSVASFHVVAVLVRNDTTATQRRVAVAALTLSAIGPVMTTAALALGALLKEPWLGAHALGFALAILGAATAVAIGVVVRHIAPAADDEPRGYVRLAIAALPVLFLALLPGAATAAAVWALQSPGSEPSITAATWSGVEWPGGLFVACVLLATAGTWAVLAILDRPVILDADVRSPRSGFGFAHVPLRRLRKPVRRVDTTLSAADRWLLTQPQFATAALAGLAALFLIR